jgi:glutathione S-transferase
MAKITLSSGVLRKGVRSTRAAAVLGQRASLFGVGRRGRAELAALNLKPASTGEDQMTANELKLYHAAASPNSRRVRIFLAEKGLAVPLVPVDLGKGEQHGEAYRAINPRRVVPTLVLEDGTAIGEVLAIWRYLEEAYPTPPLLGSTPKDKALVTMWERRAELEGFAAVMEGVRNASERLKGRAIAGPYDYDQIPALVERSRLRVKKLLRRSRRPSVCAALHCRRSFFGGRHHRLGDRRFRRQSNELSGARRAQSAETLG